MAQFGGSNMGERFLHSQPLGFGEKLEGEGARYVERPHAVRAYIAEDHSLDRIVEAGLGHGM